MKCQKCIDCNTSKATRYIKSLCIKCYKKQYSENHKAQCSMCKLIKPISTRKQEKIICKTCYKKYFFKIKKRKCSLCNKIKRIDKIENGKSICMTCYKKYYLKPKIKECSICGKIRPREGFKNNKPICGYCYRKNHTKKKNVCDKCGELNYTSKIINNKRICHSCYKKLRKHHYTALNHLRISRIKQNGGTISEQDFKRIIKRDKICIYCSNNKDLSFDHIIPVSKGGKSEFNNYVLACKKCNSSKGNRNVFEWCENKGIKVPKVIIKKVGGRRDFRTKNELNHA